MIYEFPGHEMSGDQEKLINKSNSCSHQNVRNKIVNGNMGTNLES